MARACCKQTFSWKTRKELIRREYENNIKRDLREMWYEVVDYIQLAQIACSDGYLWTCNGPLRSITVVDFFTIRTNVNFEKQRTQ
jgi:hypothetical protein